MIAAILAPVLLVGMQDAGTRVVIPDRPGDLSDGPADVAEARRVMRGYAACLVFLKRRGVESFLEVPAGTPGWSRLAGRIADSDCLPGGGLSFAPALLRGALYEALYRADYARQRNANIAEAPQIAYLGGNPETFTDEQRMWLALQDFGDCVVRAKPAESRALVLSVAESSAEARAFTAIGPALGPCLVEGARLTFSRPILRGVIAESLYRLTAAAAGATR
jgi:hypothetical protein